MNISPNAICVNGCPCDVFSVPPRTLEDREAGRSHMHDGCRVYHDGAECPKGQMDLLEGLTR